MLITKPTAAALAFFVLGPVAMPAVAEVAPISQHAEHHALRVFADLLDELFDERAASRDAFLRAFVGRFGGNPTHWAGGVPLVPELGTNEIDRRISWMMFFGDADGLVVDANRRVLMGRAFAQLAFAYSHANPDFWTSLKDVLPRSCSLCRVILVMADVKSFV